MATWSGIFAVLGMASISLALCVLGMLSRKLGKVTNAAPFYVGFFIAGGLVAVGAVTRLVHLNTEVALQSKLNDNIMWVLLYNGAPALGLTLGLMIAWRYWSWLLAERD